jgi:hypothetical protein
LVKINPTLSRCSIIVVLDIVVEPGLLLYVVIFGEETTIMTENRDFKLGFNTYGKDRVRLVKVTRGRKLLICINKLISLPPQILLAGDSSNPNKHYVEQLSVKVLLENFDPADSKKDR